MDRAIEKIELSSLHTCYKTRNVFPIMLSWLSTRIYYHVNPGYYILTFNLPRMHKMIFRTLVERLILPWWFSRYAVAISSRGRWLINHHYKLNMFINLNFFNCSLVLQFNRFECNICTILLLRLVIIFFYNKALVFKQCLFIFSMRMFL